MDFKISLPILGYTNGLFVVALLLFVYICLARITKTYQLPKFCEKCGNGHHKLFSSATYCTLKCKYNPPFRYTAIKSYYRKR